MKKLTKRSYNTFNTVEAFKKSCKCKACSCDCKKFLLKGVVKNSDKNNTNYFTLTK